MLDDKDTYNEYRERLSDFISEDEEIAQEEEVDNYDYEFDNSMNDIDFSSFSGDDFKSSFANAQKQIDTSFSEIIVPQEREVIVIGQGEEEDDEFFRPSRVARKKMSGSTRVSQVIVPEQRNVIVEGQGEEEIVRPKRVTRKPIVRTPSRKKMFGSTKVSQVIVPEQRKVIVEGQHTPTRKKREVVAKKPKRTRRPDRPPPRRKRPILEKEIFIKKGKYTLKGRRKRKISDVIIPSSRKVIVKGASDFIVSQDNDAIKNIGYYKGKKLKELILTFNNNSAIDFEMEIFNPSMPLDYLYSTSQNLNDKVQVAGGTTASYSDVLFNLLANPTFIPNSQFVFSGPSVTAQKSEALRVVSQNIAGEQKIHPLNVAIHIDTMQVANDIVYFDLSAVLNRPYIPDGMDIIRYKVLAGNTVTMAFFYMQVNLKKVFYKHANRKGIL